jgi:hypothetical protein
MVELRQLGELDLRGSVPIASIKGTYKAVISGSWTTHVVGFAGSLEGPKSDAGADAGSAGTSQGSANEQASSGNMGQVKGAGNWK